MGKSKAKAKRAAAAAAADASAAPSTAPLALHPLNTIAPFTVPPAHPPPGTAAPPMLSYGSAHVVGQLTKGGLAARTWDASAAPSPSLEDQKRVGTWLKEQHSSDGPDHASTTAHSTKPTSPRTPVTKRSTGDSYSRALLGGGASAPRGSKQWSADQRTQHDAVSSGFTKWQGTSAPLVHAHDMRAITTLFVPGLSYELPIEAVYENLHGHLSRFAPLYELRIKDLWHEGPCEGWRRVAFASYATPRLALQGFNARNASGLGQTLRLELSGKETMLDVECSGPVDITALRHVLDPHGSSPVPLPAALLGEGSQPLTGQVLYAIASLFSPCRLEMRQTGVEGTSSWTIEFANHGSAGHFLMALAQLPESEPLRCVFHRSYAERQQPRNPSPPAQPQNTAVSPETISASKGVNASLDDPFAQHPPTTPRILLGADEPETDSPPASSRLPGLFVAGQLAVPASPATPSTPPLDPHIRRQDEPSPPSSPELELRTPGGSSTQATSPLLHHKSSSVFGWGSASTIDPCGLWCGTVPFEVRDHLEELVHNELASLGEIEEIRIASLKNPTIADRPRAMAFVQFVSEASVVEALKRPLRMLGGHAVQLKPRERLQMRGSPDRTDSLAPNHLALMPPSPSPSSRKDNSKGNTPRVRNATSRKVSDASSHGGLGLDLGHIPYTQAQPMKMGRNVPRGPAAGWKQSYRSTQASQRGGWTADHASFSAAQQFLNGPHSPDERQAVAQALAIAHAQVMAHHQRFEHVAGQTAHAQASFGTAMPFMPTTQQATSMQQQAWPPNGMIISASTPFVVPSTTLDAAAAGGQAQLQPWLEGVPLPFDASLFYGEAESMKTEKVTPEVQSENLRLYAQPIAIPAWASDD